MTTRGYSEGPNVLERVDKCQKLLLEAGADPSIDLSSAGGVLPSWTPFNNILARGSIVSDLTILKSLLTCLQSSAEVFLDYGKHFIDIEIRDIDGKTPLLQSSEGRYTSIHHSAAFLLQRGANVHALDFKGDSCLHMALRGSKGPDYFNSEFKLLVMLVKAGVDVYRRNMAGVSVSETAYHRSPMGPWVDNCGSYFGDLWHRVLAECGYQVSDFRQQSPRTGRYTTEHPRE